MRILYGVQATGNGHITRARAMAHALKQTDVEVDFLFTGRSPDQLFNMEPFGDYQVRTGLSFATRKGRVCIHTTLKQAKPRKLFQDIKELDLSSYDLVLNDFEPVSAWAAKKQKVRSIGLSHQAAFGFDIPKTGQDIGSKLVMRYYAPTLEQIGVHWHNFGFQILPPIIDVDMARKEAIPGKILVYLPFEELSIIQELLKPFTAYEFFIYHPDAQDFDEDHLHLRALSRVTFEEHLKEAEGVIANGGFELPSEALYLGKKVLAKPLYRQFEQESNVLTLSQLNLAHTMQKLSREKIEAFLTAPAAEPVEYPDVAACISQWLAEGATRPVQELADELWRKVRFPGYVKEVDG